MCKVNFHHLLLLLTLVVSKKITITNLFYILQNFSKSKKFCFVLISVFKEFAWLSKRYQSNTVILTKDIHDKNLTDLLSMYLY